MKVQKRKIVFCSLFAVLSLIGLIVLTNLVRTDISQRNQKKIFYAKQETIKKELEQMEENEEDLRKQYDTIYRSKIDTISLMASETNLKISEDFLKEMQKTIDAENCFLLDREGHTIYEAVKSDLDFSSARFNQLRTVLTDPSVYEPLTIDFKDRSVRFYASVIHEDEIAVIAVNTEAIEQNVSMNTSLKRVLEKIHVGLDGSVMVVDSRNYNVIYNQSEDLIGNNAIEEGMLADELTDGYDGIISFHDDDYYVSVMQKDQYFYICMIPQSEILNSTFIVFEVLAAVFAVFLFLLLIYYIFLEHEIGDEEEEGVIKKSYSHKLLRQKMRPLVVLGILSIFVLSLYLQTLVNLSQQSININANVKQAVSAIEQEKEETDRLIDEYDNNYLETCQLASFVIKQVEGKKNLSRDFMIKLRNCLQVEQVWYMDLNGKTIASDQDFWSWKISDYETDPSYDFWMILEGQMPTYIQDPMENDMGVYMQSIGVAMLDDNYHTKGMVLISISTDRLEAKLINTSLSSLLQGVQTSRDGFAFAINKETGVFDYFPDEKINGQKAITLGLTENQICSHYNDFLKINGTKYYVSSLSAGKEYIYIAVPANTMGNMAILVSLVLTVYSALVLLLLWQFLCWERKGDRKELLSLSESQTMSDGEDSSDGKTEKKIFLQRVNQRSVLWKNKTSGQKLFTVIRMILILFSALFLVLLYHLNTSSSSDTIIRYILQGSWHKGWNIFAITSCVIIIIVTNVIIGILRYFLSWIIQYANARTVTIVHMMDNFLKVASIIGLCYYCLGLFGIDTKTLVASAGLLTLIIGLGANSLVNDVIAGMFLILEGEFQVGDIITIDNFRGTVTAIGVRTVKVMDSSGNIKIFSNRNVTNVLNMTANQSAVRIDMSIEYDEDLERVERILEKELPLIAERLPHITSQPRYLGVAMLNDSSVDLRFVCHCKEKDRFSVECAFRRELKLMFDRYEINIPYPQVVVHRKEKENVK